MSAIDNRPPAANKPPDIGSPTERSNKKTKRTIDQMQDSRMEGIVTGENTDVPQASQTATGEGQAAPPPSMSYKEKLSGVVDPEEERKKFLAELEITSDDEDGDGMDEYPGIPMVRIPREERARLRVSWRQSLIIKVWGRTIGYTYLQRRLKAIWRPSSSMDLITLDNDYFLVKFQSEEDYKYAKFGGPWVVMDHYLIVSEWIPNFDPRNEKTEKLLVWIRFPQLPVEYYNYRVLKQAGNTVGRFVKIDDTTSLVSKGRFARVCVEIDITQPLQSLVVVDRKLLRVQI